MLIAIAGSQGSGKTTLLNELARKGFKVIERKTSRSILKDWGYELADVYSNQPLTVKFQDEIIKRKIEDECEAAQSDDIWFTERTYTDLFTYATVVLGWNNEYSNYLNNYYEQCKVAQATYSHVFYLEGGKFQIEHDGVRGSNQFYGRMVDLMMHDSIYRMTSPDKLSIIETSILPLRVEIIEEEIEYIKGNHND